VLQQSKTKEQVYLEISGLYYNAQILKNRLDFLRKNLINSQRLHQNIQLLYDQKLAMRTDLDKVILQIQQLEMQVFQVESQYTTILKGMKFAMGLPLDTELEIPTAIAEIEESGWESKSTLDYQIQESRLKIASHELRTLKNSRIPSLSLYGNFGTTGFGYTGDPEAFLDFYRVSFVGAQVSFPLFNGTVTQKKIRQKELELTTSQIQKDLVSDQTMLQTQTALAQQSVSARQLETSKSQIELAESVYVRTLLQQKEKMASLTEVLLADNALRDSQQQYLNAMVDYLKATLELKKSSGTLLN
jgi:OMF family outer membrane factor